MNVEREAIRQRCQALLEVIVTARRYLKTPKLAEAVHRSCHGVRRDMFRLRDAGLVKWDPVYRGWRPVSEVVVCTKCRKDFESHQLIYPEEGMRWRCPS